MPDIIYDTIDKDTLIVYNALMHYLEYETMQKIAKMMEIPQKMLHA